jgi:hypothetical protein
LQIIGINLDLILEHAQELADLTVKSLKDPLSYLDARQKDFLIRGHTPKFWAKSGKT